MQKFSPLVSIIIPIYNGSNYMQEAIDSALNQTYKNIEIIVVNDGSKDNTEEIAKSYGDKIKYFSKENGGVATALNLAIKESKGEYISWLSHDDIYYQNKIERQIHELSKFGNKNIILYSDYIVINKRGKELYEVELNSSHELRKLNNGLYSVLNGCLHGCSILIPKNMFTKYGYFNEGLRHIQDYEFWFRIFKNGTPAYHIPEFLIKSRVHKGQDSKKEFFQANKECDEFWINILSSLSNEEFQKIDGNKYFILDKISKTVLKAYRGAQNWTNNLLEEMKKEHLKEFERPPKISTIITCYNQADTILNAVNSVLEQNYGNKEIIVIDDGSNDTKTLDILNRIDEIQNVSVYHTTNAKVSAARNYGLKIAIGDYIQFLDGDDILLPEKFNDQINHFKYSPGISVSYSNFNYYNKKLNNLTPVAVKNIKLSKFKQFEDLLYNWQNPLILPIHTMLFKKECFQNVQFPVEVSVNEDYIVWLTLLYENFKFGYLPTYLCNYNIHHAVKNHDAFKVMLDVTNVIFMIREKFKNDFDEKTLIRKKYFHYRSILDHYFKPDLNTKKLVKIIISRLKRIIAKILLYN